MIVALVAIILVCSLSFFAFVYAQPTYHEKMQFHPEVPTEQSNVTAIIFLTTPTPCHRVELQDFKLSGKELSINVQITQPPADTVCILVLKEHVIKQNIGILDAGAYDVMLYINGEVRTESKLYVTEYDVAVLSTGRYTDDQDDVNLVGEVQNTGSEPIKRVRVDVMFFEDGRLLKEEQIFTTMAIIMPNHTSGFSLALRDELKDKEYSIRITSFTIETATIEQALMLTVEPRIEDGHAVVIGSVSNSADRNATQVKVVCALYDSGGAVIDSVFGYTDPAYIAPDSEVQFEILPHHEVVDEFTASCNAESTEFALQEVRVVPEFPVAAAALALASFAGLAVNRFRNKFQ